MNRRDFVKAAAIGAAIKRPAAGAGMYISLNGSLTGGRVAWPEFARLAARTGFGGVDMNLAAALKEGLDATRALLSELNLKPSNLNLPATFSRDEAAFQTSLKKLDEAATFCAAIQCPTMLGILPPSSQTPKTELRKIVKDRLSAIGEILLREAPAELGVPRTLAFPHRAAARIHLADGRGAGVLEGMRSQRRAAAGCMALASRGRDHG